LQPNLFYMKRFLLAGFVIATIISCKSKSEKDFDNAAKIVKDSANFTTVQWIDSIVNFGSINKGEKIDIRFRCKNTGTKPLILANVRPGCGCTVADYTKEPILPGAEGLITASFDSNKTGATGEVDKTIIVSSNTPVNPVYLHFKGTINGGESNDKVAVPHPIQQKK